MFKSPHPAFGHLLPFFEREKAIIMKRGVFSLGLLPCAIAWEKVPKGDEGS